MVSEQYWKDKRIGRRQVLIAWAIVILLAAGAQTAQLAEIAYRGIACAVATDAPTAMAAKESYVVAPKSQGLQQVP